MEDLKARYRDVFPDADERRRWNALSQEQQEAEFREAVERGLNSPRAALQTKEEIIAAVLARYAVAS